MSCGMDVIFERVMEQLEEELGREPSDTEIEKAVENFMDYCEVDNGD